ncbi:ATP dependent peptidase CodWX, CodW component [Thermaerobacter marianensis DSM 12885]|uniref:ATP-dependent protease subunit HslV n=1 Tax=Thermaerobacter marianensis (strain ATCC 700841 / DSM 12885 / JCM 10246 / 7p75a) TaxID=644966 RepID=E6SJM3_THEM7|nr:ATP-dependent protease subunit HslV [Thermaerobacter marianensis]ADU51086.1 ATP dependent peptidase CodWX, CodW component [Thermaerobacter marianensis DSM 12885]
MAQGPVRFHGTTVLAVRRDGKVAMAGDGQVTMEQHMVMKHRARKVRRLYHGRVLAGFAGSVADAVALMERFEAKLEEHAGQLVRAAVELAKDWRTDRLLRRLEAVMVVADADHVLLVSGSGEVLEPDDGIVAVGSGAGFALAAARALARHTNLDAAAICREAMRIAAELCVYTNDQLIVEEL